VADLKETMIMKIALIAGHLGSPSRPARDAYPGDPAADVLSLARALAAQGQQVTVYAPRDSAAPPRRGTLGRGVTVKYVAASPQARLPDDAARLGDDEVPPYLPAFADQLAARWRRSAPDLVHAHSWTSGLAALAGARDLGIPVVQTFRSLGADPASDDGQAARDRSARIRLEAAIGRTAHAVLVGSSDERSQLGRRGVPPTSVWVIPPGVDVTRFQPSGPAAARGSEPRLLMIGPPDDHQALSTAARALADVPDAELLVIGGPASARQDRITCPAAVSQAALPALMRSADVLIHLTTSESFARVPLDAMACGVPVIGLDAGPSRDAVIDGVTGYLVPPGQPALLAGHLRQFLASPMLREGCGIAAASRARHRYSWERISQETLAVYQALPRRRLPAAA
jgi:glycosyltransferase involved in cell wall biosynthesis